MVPKDKKKEKKERSKTGKAIKAIRKLNVKPYKFKAEIDLTPPTTYKIIRVSGGYKLQINMYIDDSKFPQEEEYLFDE